VVVGARNEACCGFEHVRVVPETFGAAPASNPDIVDDDPA
jgi:hypothetical protein